MKKFFGWIFNRWVISVLGIILLSLIIWFVGPLIEIADWAPLESPEARFVTMLVVVLIWALYNIFAALRSRQENAQVIDGLSGEMSAEAEPDMASQASQEEIAALRNRFREALDVLKKAKLGGSGRRRRLYQLPWYLLIGPPGAGKTTALKNSGLRFPLMDRFGSDSIQGVGGTRNCDWWFTDEAVILDTAGRYTTQDSDQTVDHAAWIGFLDLLKKYRRRRPIDGVIIAFSLNDIAQRVAGERQLHAQSVRKRLQELHNYLKVKVPVYVVFTKCDLVAGFIEFFDDLGREERGQVWGMTFPIEVSERPGAVLQTYGPEFDMLMKRLDRRLYIRLDQERDVYRRGAMQGFTQQLSGVRGPIQDFLTEVFQPSRFEDTAMLRGVYLSSGTQEGTPIDRVISAVSGTFGLDRQAMPAFSGPGRSYFLSRLLREVIFREADLVWNTGAFYRYRHWIQRGAYAAAALVVILAGAAWTTSYLGNDSFIDQLAFKTQDYEARQPPADSLEDELDVLPSLDELRAFPGGFDERDRPVPFLMGFGLYQGDKLGDAASAAYRRALNTQLLPRMVERLEVQMRGNVDRPDYLYEALKVYLMLGSPKHMEAEFVELWTLLDWEERFPGPENEEARTRLQSHLTAMLQGQLAPPPLDGTLVNQVRDVLVQRPVAARVYGQVRRELLNEGLEDWRVTEEIGIADARYFTRRTRGMSMTDGIPGLFTYDGFRNEYLPKSTDHIKVALYETWVLGPEHTKRLGNPDIATLTRDVTELYLKEYADQWERYLADVDLIGFRGFGDAPDIANALSKPDSPIKKFLGAVVKETELAKIPLSAPVKEVGKDRLKELRDRLLNRLDLDDAGDALEMEAPGTVVDRKFKRLHALYETGPEGQVPIDRVISMIYDLYVYLSEASRSQTARIEGGNAVEQLQVAARRQPAPLDRWLRSLALGSSELQVGALRDRLNGIWTVQVAPYCQRALGNRYPLSPGGGQDVNLNDFARMFGPDGLMDSFFNQHLQPYVDTSVRPWQLLKSAGTDQPLISEQVVRQFEAAARIKEAYFTGGSNQPTVRFRVKPVFLDESIGQVMLQLGDQRLIYRHDPQRLRGMQWPPPDGDVVARIEFTPLGGGRKAILQSEGPWAFFRLLDQARVQSTSLADRFKVTFRVQGFTATYELRAASVINPFRQKNVAGFRCLERL